jgi:histidinol-phosphate aminotransferase
MNKHLSLARPDILTLKPYEHAVWDPAYERLHANESPWRTDGDASTAGLNRYPECPPVALIARLAQLYGVNPKQLTVGRGSDEGIDLLCRAFCRAGVDSVIVCPPTFGFYKVAAKVQGANVIEVPLVKERNFALDRAAVLAAWNPTVKLVFLCSPGNPTGNLLDANDMEALCAEFDGKAMVVIDEAYMEFAERESAIRLIDRFSNLVILRTLSKAYALAGARVGSIIADAAIIELLDRVLPPYAIPTSTVETVLAVTDKANRAQFEQRVTALVSERKTLAMQLAKSALIKRVWPSDANFILVECADADAVLNAARSVKLVIRDQRTQPQLANCLRISVGTPEQNARLVRALVQNKGAAA